MKYYCKYCGADYKTVADLVVNICRVSPTKKHVLYEGGEKSVYTCKLCGATYKNLRDMLINYCRFNKGGKHEPAL